VQATVVLIALSSAACAAVSTSLQHRSASGAPATAVGSGRLMVYLLRRPAWLSGLALSLTSFGLHALALRFGALAVVQPVVVSGMVFAVPVRAAMSRRLPDAGELRAVLVTAIGLAAFLVSSHPTGGAPRPAVEDSALLFTAIALAGAVPAQVLAGRYLSGRRRAVVLGGAAGVHFGLLAGLLKLSAVEVQQAGPSVLLTGWWVGPLVLVGLVGAAVNQQAYRAGPLSTSMPVLNTVDVLVGLSFGLAVFGEVPAHTAGAIAVQVLALSCIALGLRNASSFRY
jgi:hypothetical protein